MGKSLRVKRMAKLIEKGTRIKNTKTTVCVPIHGPEVSIHHILTEMKECQQDPTDPYPQLIHFNIAQNVSRLVYSNVTCFVL